jgi:hypothetical protein
MCMIMQGGTPYMLEALISSIKTDIEEENMVMSPANSDLRIIALARTSSNCKRQDPSSR